MWDLYIVFRNLMLLILSPFRLLGRWVLNRTISFDTAFEASCKKAEHEERKRRKKEGKANTELSGETSKIVKEITVGVITSIIVFAITETIRHYWLQ